LPSYLTSVVLEWSSDSLTDTWLTNPTFDAGITGWTEVDSGVASMTPTHETTSPARRCSKLVNTQPGEFDYMTATFTGVSGSTYKIRAWVNATVVTFGSAGIQAFGPAGVPGAITSITGVTSGWQQHEVSLTLVSSGTVTVRPWAAGTVRMT
jgi:hypothetical protein